MYVCMSVCIWAFSPTNNLFPSRLSNLKFTKIVTVEVTFKVTFKNTEKVKVSVKVNVMLKVKLTIKM